MREDSYFYYWICDFGHFYEVGESSLPHGGISKRFFLDHFSPSFLAKNGIFGYRFHFEGKHDEWISQIRCVKSFFAEIHDLKYWNLPLKSSKSASWRHWNLDQSNFPLFLLTTILRSNFLNHTLDLLEIFDWSLQLKSGWNELKWSSSFCIYHKFLQLIQLQLLHLQLWQYHWLFQFLGIPLGTHRSLPKKRYIIKIMRS